MKYVIPIGRNILGCSMFINNIDQASESKCAKVVVGDNNILLYTIAVRAGTVSHVILDP